MGRDRHYVLGEFYRVDDRTGFPTRARHTRKEWTGLYVDRIVWEPRHPQDFVKGVIDDQSVPDPRPLPPDDFVGPLTTAIGQSFVPGNLLLEGGGGLLLEDSLTPLQLEPISGMVGATMIPVVSSNGMQIGDTVQIMLDINVFFSTTILLIPSSITITIASPLPHSASPGNIVQDLTASVNVSVV